MCVSSLGFCASGTRVSVRMWRLLTALPCFHVSYDTREGQHMWVLALSGAEFCLSAWSSEGYVVIRVAHFSFTASDEQNCVCILHGQRFRLGKCYCVSGTYWMLLQIFSLNLYSNVKKWVSFLK